VVFRGSNGVTVTAHADTNGTFTVAVPPGRYTVTGSSPTTTAAPVSAAARP
jgi:hypothetical protein